MELNLFVAKYKLGTKSPVILQIRNHVYLEILLGMVPQAAVEVEVTMIICEKVL